MIIFDEFFYVFVGYRKVWNDKALCLKGFDVTCKNFADHVKVVLNQLSYEPIKTKSLSPAAYLSNAFELLKAVLH